MFLIKCQQKLIDRRVPIVSLLNFISFWNLKGIDCEINLLNQTLTREMIFESSLSLIWPKNHARKSRMSRDIAFSSDLHGCPELQVRLHAARNRLSIRLFVYKWHPAANIRPKTKTCRCSHNWCPQVTMRLNRLIRLALCRINEA